METEDQICRRYEAELAAIATLDRRYYGTTSAAIDERREYAERQVRLEEMRSRFYSDLAACRIEQFSQARKTRRCRSINRRPRFSTLRAS